MGRRSCLGRRPAARPASTAPMPLRILPLLLALVLAAVPSSPRAQALPAAADTAPSTPLSAVDAAARMDGAAPPAAAESAVVRPLNTAGGALDEALRAAQLRGEAPTAGYLLRSPSSLVPAPAGGGARVWL